MKRTTGKSSRVALRKEYAFDYAKSKPNRFATQLKDTKVVVLQPDVAKVFKSAESVNDLLRSAIAATGGAKPARQRLTAQSSGRSPANAGSRR
jgi:hypothetical protein